MTTRAELSSRVGACVPGSASTAYACRRARQDPTGLNGIAWRQTNSTKDAHGAAAPTRTPWAAIVVAILTVALVIGVELWAARRAPPPDGTVASTVASEVSATLGDVAASSILIDP
jgi:hypothetical protein